MPSGDVGTVRSLERDSQACSIARSGDNVAVSLQGIDGNNVMAGGVLCHPDFPVSVAKHLEVKVLVLDVASPILIGSQVNIVCGSLYCFLYSLCCFAECVFCNWNEQLEFHIHHAKEAARVVKILSLLDSKTGKVAKENPRCLTAKQSAVVEVNFDNITAVAKFSSHLLPFNLATDTVCFKCVPSLEFR